MKKVLITGISSEILERFIIDYSNKYIIIGIYNSNSKENIYNNYNNIYLYKCDISNEEEVSNTISVIKDKFNSIDVLINGASIEEDMYILDKDSISFNKVITTNITGTFLMIKYSIKYLNVVRVINISSTDSIDTYNEYNIDYSVSKCGINMMNNIFKSIFNNIKFILVLLNYVDTSSTRKMDSNYLEKELNRIGQKELISTSTISKKLDELISSNEEIVRIDNND